MKKLTWYWYLVARALIRFLFPAPEFEGVENLPKDRPCIIVGNHAHLYGPFYSELYLPCNRAIWCIADAMNLRKFPDYAFRDFWPRKPRWCRWFYRILSFVIAPMFVGALKHAHCIGVYRDSRLLSTMRESLKRMKGGDSIVIFPEHDVPYNGIVWEFQEGFVTLASMYARQTGKPVDFVPMYIAPALKKVRLGAPIAFDPTANPDEERTRVCRALMDAITEMARSMPLHKAVPYPNISRKLYRYNRESETR